MADLNSVNIIGRLTRDAEVRYTQNGKAISNFSIAVNRRRKDGDQWVEEVSYFDVSLFGKSAESLKQYLQKGKQVGICGELRQDRWEKDGQKYNKVYIVANDIQLLGGNATSGNGNSYGSNGYQSGNSQGYGQSRFSSQSSFSQRNDMDQFDPGSSYNDESFPDDVPF